MRPKSRYKFYEAHIREQQIPRPAISIIMRLK